MVGTVREIFLCYLSEMLRASGASSSTAIALSGTFPLLGVPGLMLSGYLVDHYDRKRNGEIVAVNCGNKKISTVVVCGSPSVVV
eukprot:m.499215 g.499215  ORF g.499215 m.499215 type:complete len:84 (+) comp21825_c0_seq8:401-652(+)